MIEPRYRDVAKSGRVRVASLEQLDALVGEIVTGQPPDVAWQDSYGLFRFSSRAEAEEAICNSYYRLFCPELDWETATVQEIRQFPPYSSSVATAWSVVECLGLETQHVEICMDGSFWRATFANTVAFAHTPALAICLAGLRVRGVDPIFCESLFDDAPASRIDTAHDTGLPMEAL